MEVIAAMAVRTTATAAAVLTAAVAVYALHVSCRNRRLRRLLASERVSSRLMTGCLVRDLAEFRRRLGHAMAQQAVLAAAGLVLDDALSAHDSTTPPTEGGPR
jgi:hypothetical protein